MTNSDANNESSMLEDLTAQNTNEIKGGPKLPPPTTPISAPPPTRR